MGDTPILSDFPLLLERQEWQKVAALAQLLATETLEAERRDHAETGTSWRGWACPPRSGVCGSSRWHPVRKMCRVMRFDFHFTTEGWRISEVNADVPGGFNEASGFTRLMAEQYPDTATTGDPAAAWRTPSRWHRQDC